MDEMMEKTDKDVDALLVLSEMDAAHDEDGKGGCSG
jgi:hypothetical protein